MKWAQAWIITKAACDEHQFLVKIRYDAKIKSPAWVRC
jgi:hypothetical protein